MRPLLVTVFLVACKAPVVEAPPPPPSSPVVAPPSLVEISDEAGRPTIRLEQVQPGTYAARDFTGRPFAAVAVGPESVELSDRTNATLALLQEGDRGLAVVDGQGAPSCLLRVEGPRTRLLLADGGTLAVVDKVNVVRKDGAAVTTTIRVAGAPPLVAQLMTLNELDVYARPALVAWFTLR